MAHQFEDGFFVGEPAWHELGTVLDTSPTVEEAYILSGLNWTVIKENIYHYLDAKYAAIPNKVVLKRDDNKQILGIVSPQYNPLQNKQLFDFIAPYINENSLMFESAGCLKEGKKVFILCDVHDNIREVVPNDPVKYYYLLTNNHEGLIAASFLWTTVRVVCANTLDLALKSLNKKVIYHNTNLEQSIANMHNELDIAKCTFINQVNIYKDLSRVDIPIERARQILETLFQQDIQKSIDIKKSKVNTILDLENNNVELDSNILEDDLDYYLDTYRPTKLILDNYENLPNLQVEGVRGNGWGFYNALTNYYTHQRKGSYESRYDNIWDGKVNKVYNLAKQLILN